ncbi:tryptophan-rich sensory protein [Spirosoma sp. KCTC 42546]|uniref:TspO/MBR family protein n=1 Tax=Spirosoma sp. KCTC 42546 TaxID=2520506 RepID=UPI00115A184A|nr:TspO/MBR family protein [Spirosoma sp. KCTC 42546]QDK77233.1 tryptophan-rich sensory protein [Spirosoma sp. KCTC 42546]
MKNDRLRQFFVVFSVISLIVMNYLSNVGAFGGKTNKEISDKYHTLITPAGYAFSIWGIIFLGLLAFAVYQGLGTQRTNPRFRAIGWWVVLNGFCNAIWSPLFNNEQIGIALVVILVMLFSLLIIEQRLLEKKHVPIVAIDQNATLPESTTSSAETWLARVPFSIYFGWLTVATILNVTVYLKATDFGLMDLSEQTWAVAMLIVGLLVGTVVFNRFRSIAYILVFAWAYVAIAVEQTSYNQIKLVAGAGAIIAVGLAIAGLISRKTPSYS